VYIVVRLVRIYQRIDDGERREEFESWVRSTGAFGCSRCGDVFAPPEKVAEDAEVLCSLCRGR
jgi:hypothetical protein